jgi:outer membrane protein OmpA-like peptidoglycan-associated protein
MTTIMIKRALLLLLLTAVWAFGSWWYYTCMIKGFCRADGVFTSATEKAKTAAISATAITTGAVVASGDKVADAVQPTTTDFVDQDGDAISDEDERSLGTDPAKKDSDGDGIEDNEELGIDLLNPIDTDNDGIINALDEDDDNDGIPSQLESNFSSNPLSADSDGDGTNDGDELGDDKENPADSDNDGIIDLIDNIDDNAEQAKDATQEPSTDDQADAKDAVDATPADAAPADTAPTETAASETPATDATQGAEKPAADDEVTVDTGSDQQAANADIPVQKSRLYFPFRSANPGLSDAATKYFEGVVAWLNQSPSNSVVLTGHTDDIGKAENNLNLGLKRAVEIKDMMTKLGANPVQVEVASMGETQPIASNKTDDGRRKNRRVELIPAIKQ